MSGNRLNKRALGKVIFYQVPFDIRADIALKIHSLRYSSCIFLVIGHLI